MNSLQCSCCNFCVVDCNVAEYGQLSPCGPPAITDRGREATSPAKSEQSKNLWKHKAAFTDLRYYGIADTSCGPRVTDFHCSSLVTTGQPNDDYSAASQCVLVCTLNILVHIR